MKINENFSKINKYIKNVKNVLDESIYGQEKAKQQLEKSETLKKSVPLRGG